MGSEKICAVAYRLKVSGTGQQNSAIRPGVIAVENLILFILDVAFFDPRVSAD
jgi:hypothetical protein